MQQSNAYLLGIISSSEKFGHQPSGSVASFKLLPYHAITLCVQTAGELRVAHGQLWVTFTGAATDASVVAGDHFLQPGESLCIADGQSVVMEALDVPASGEEMQVIWAPNAQALQPLPADEVRQALTDLGGALYQAAFACSRLLQGLAGGVLSGVSLRRKAL